MANELPHGRAPARAVSLPALIARPATLASLVVAGLVLLAVAIRIWLTRRIPAPWIMGDELLYSSLAKSFSEDHHMTFRQQPWPFLSIYPAVVSPAWLAGSMDSTYSIVKAMNAVLMSLVAIPVYVWARRLVSPVYAVAGRRARAADAGLRLRQRGDDREPRVPGRDRRAARHGARARASHDCATGSGRRRDRAGVYHAAAGARAVSRAADGDRAQGAARRARGAASVASPLSCRERSAATRSPAPSSSAACSPTRATRRSGAGRCTTSSASTAASRGRATCSRLSCAGSPSTSPSSSTRSG